MPTTTTTTTTISCEEPSKIDINSSRRCSDPNLYSLKNTSSSTPSSTKTHNIMYLPPLLSATSCTSSKEEQQQQLQFTDTSCLMNKSIMIDRLIDTAADIIDSIFWANRNKVTAMSTSNFVREILKRSRATYSMLQLALFYIFRIKKKLITLPYCGRRMFLAALMLASKYLNDKNYKNKTWAMIASLDVKEINATEIVFLKLIDYQLYVCKPLYDKWVSLLHGHIQKKNHFIKQQQQQQQELPLVHPIMLKTTASVDKAPTQKEKQQQKQEEMPHHLRTPNQDEPQHILSPATTASSSSSAASERSLSPYTPNDIAASATPPPALYNNSKKRPFSSVSSSSDEDLDYDTTGTAVKHFRPSSSF